jgi:hypothetical protein
MGILAGNSSALLVKGGITRLSELEIDCDKDWNGKTILNISGAAAGTPKGGVLVHDGSILVTVIPGSIGHGFTDGGPGHAPSWEEPAG